MERACIQFKSYRIHALFIQTIWDKENAIMFIRMPKFTKTILKTLSASLQKLKVKYGFIHIVGYVQKNGIFSTPLPLFPCCTLRTVFLLASSFFQQHAMCQRLITIPSRSSVGKPWVSFWISLFQLSFHYNAFRITNQRLQNWLFILLDKGLEKRLLLGLLFFLPQRKLTRFYIMLLRKASSLSLQVHSFSKNTWKYTG